MTTARSPLRLVLAQASKMAATLKGVERGETVAEDLAGKIAAARARVDLDQSGRFGSFLVHSFCGRLPREETLVSAV